MAVEREIVCAQCGKAARVTHPRAKYCSHTCQLRANRGEERRKKALMEPAKWAARRAYMREYYRAHSDKWTGYRIKGAPFVPKQLTCPYCDESFTTKTRSQIFCSEKCARRARKVRAFARFMQKVKSGDANAVALRSRRLEYQRTYNKIYAPHNGARAKAMRGAVEKIDVFAVFDRDGWRCQVCGIHTPPSLRRTKKPRAPELDHRIPVSRGGTHTYDNVQLTCFRCNMRKGARRVVGQLPMFARPHDLVPQRRG